MDPNDREQTELLRHIWNEMKALGTNPGPRIDRVSQRLDRTRTELKAEIAGTNERLDLTNERLGIVESTLQELSAQPLMLGRYVKNATVRNAGALDELRERVTLIEARLTPKR